MTATCKWKKWYNQDPFNTKIFNDGMTALMHTRRWNPFCSETTAMTYYSIQTLLLTTSAQTQCGWNAYLSRSEAIRPTRTNCFRLCVALTHSFVLPWPPVQSTFAHPYLAVTCAHTIYCITLHFLYILSYYTCFYCLLDLSYYFIFYYIYVTSYLYVNKNQYSRTNSWYC